VGKHGTRLKQRPVLEHVEGPIGGHCIIPGVEKLADSGCNLAEIILQLNNQLILPGWEHHLIPESEFGSWVEMNSLNTKESV